MTKAQEQQNTTQKELETLQTQHKGEIDKLQTIQGHLTKKIRENTELRDLLTLQTQKTNESQHISDNLKTQLTNIESKLQMQQEHEDRLQRLITEQTKTAREETKEWERKYFKMNDTLQHTQTELHDLKRIEEEYQQMKQLFGHIQTFFTPSTIPLLANPQSKEPPSLTPSPSPSPQIQQSISKDLFTEKDVNKEVKKVKKGLFD